MTTAQLDEQWLTAQNQVLEHCSTGAALPAVLHHLARGAEQQVPGMRCVVMLADEQGQRLEVVAAPSMPETFTTSVGSLSIGENEAACGAAAFNREAVATEDVSTDPRWEKYRDFAEQFEIRSCWSNPILGSDGRVLGTFAMVYDQPQRPSVRAGRRERQIIDTCVQLAALAIERRQAEHAQRESEARFRAMADAAPVLMWMAGLDTTCFYFNRPWLTFTGRTIDQERGEGWIDGVHPADVDQCVAIYNAAFDRREAFQADFRLRRADGEYRWVLNHGVPRHAPDGTFLGFIGSCVDITDRKRAEQALRESEAWFRHVVDGMAVAVYVTDAEGNILRFNREAARFWGREPKIGGPEDRFCGSFRIYTPEGQRLPHDRCPMAQVLRTGKPLQGQEIVVERPDGMRLAALASPSPVHDEDGRMIGAVNCLVDISDRRKMEQDLRENEGRLRFTLESARVGTWDWDVQANSLRWSDNLEAVHGQRANAFDGRVDSFLKHIVPEDRPRVVQVIRRAIEEGKPYETEYRIRQIDGSLGWMVTRGRVIYDAHGKPERITGICIDVTERREAEQSLRVQARQQETVAQLGHRALAGGDLQALMDDTVMRVAETLEVPLVKVLELEPGGQRLHLRAGLGWQPGLVGHATVATDAGSQGAYTLRSEQPVIVSDLRTEQRFAGASMLHQHGVISGLSVIITGVGGQPWGVLGAHARQRRDFTRDDIHFLQSVAHLLAAAIQRRTAERQLEVLNETLEQRVAERTAVAERQAAQLRSLAGELTQAESRERRRLAQILHDHLQQLLVAAKLRVSVLLERVRDDELADATRQVDELLEKSIESSRSLTVELSPPILYDAGLPAALEWLGRWMQEQHGLTVNVQTALYDDTTPELAGDAHVFLFNAVRELLFNVVKHAGVKRVHVQVSCPANGPLSVVVSDDGKGFDLTAMRERDVSDSGFGLFSIQQRVELLGGRLEVDSQPGNGTCIVIEVPVAAESAADTAMPSLMLSLAASTGHSASSDDAFVDAEDEASEDAKAPVLVENAPADAVEGEAPQPPIRVLLADDHAPLRKGLVTLLAGQRDIEIVGHAVDGQTVVDLARRLQPDVVVMDVTMPGLNGVEATRRLARECPAVRVVGLSIHEQQDMADAMQSAGAAAYLTKGGPPDALFAAIRAPSAAAASE